MRPIDNPVADAVNAFRAAWRMPEAREQLMDFMLSLDGLRSKLEPRICKDRNITALQRVLRDRLQDLEAERLTELRDGRGERIVLQRVNVLEQGIALHGQAVQFGLERTPPALRTRRGRSPACPFPSAGGSPCRQ